MGHIFKVSEIASLHSLKEYFLSAYYEPDMVLGPGGRAVSNGCQCYHRTYTLEEKTDINQIAQIYSNFIIFFQVI